MEKFPRNSSAPFFEQYKKLADSERKDLLKKVGLAVNQPSLLKRILAWLGIEDQFFALAQVLPPFGGTIGMPIPCPCSLSFLLPVGLPTPPVSGFLFVPYSFLGSPLFYNYESMRPGAWWLGLYTPAVLPCLSVPPFCPPIGMGNLIYMTGTSY